MHAGPAEREVRALLLGYASLVRAVVTVACLLLGLLVVPGAHPWPAVTGMLALLGWTVAYAVFAARSPSPWLAGIDVALLCTAAITQQWTVPPRASEDSTGWVLAVMTVTAVTLQWFTTTRAGAGSVLAFIGAYLAGAFWAVGDAEFHRLTMLLWLIPQATLSRICAIGLTTAARRSDRLAAEQERERIAATVNAARRADEREQQALLHDTVAATLLMVGVGAVAASSPWLRDQAARDLRVLRQTSPPAPTDLAELLRQEIGRSPVRVGHRTLPRLRVPAAVAAAIAGAVREALTNVFRHAGVDEASLSVELDPLRITITDAGAGFHPESVTPHRRGIASSIVARTAAGGGRAGVSSAPGRGTTVTLEFPDA